MTKLSKYGAALALTVICNACATFKPQYAEEKVLLTSDSDKNIAYSIYIASGGGNAEVGKDEKAFALLESHLAEANEASTLLFTGDNVSRDDEDWGIDKLVR